MVGSCKENGGGSNAMKDDGRKTVCRKKKRKISLEMVTWRRSRSESNEDKAVDGEDERQTAVDSGCSVGQVSPRAVALRGGGGGGMY